MELLPPQLRVLPSVVQLIATVDQIRLWEIDSPSLEWSLILAFLFSTIHMKNFANSLGRMLRTKERPKADHWVYKTKRSVTKHNPFMYRYNIYHDRILKMTLQRFKIKLLSEMKGLEKTCFHVLKTAAKLFECVILLYDVNPTGKCQWLSTFSSTEFMKDDTLKLFIFIHTSATSNSAVVRFGFGLSFEYSHSLRHSALLHCLRAARLKDEELIKVQQVKYFGTNLLALLLKVECEEIIHNIYNSPLVTLRITEAGFDIDPCTLDANGFSAFYHSMGRSDNDCLMILYDFATNKSNSIESSVRNPDSDILLALEKVGDLIKNDRLMSKYFTSSGLRNKIALNRCHWIMYFNEYQQDICKQIYLQKQQDISMERNKKIMILILHTYSKYFYFDVPINIHDKYSFFKHFVEYSEFYEKLDYFTCLLVFDNFTGLIPLINKNNSQIYLDAISSLFLAVLSNKLYPKHKQGIHCFACVFESDCRVHSFDEKKSAQRFIPFHYRSCFLKNAEALLIELQNTSPGLQEKPLYVGIENTSTGGKKESLKLLEFLKDSLTSFPEIVDEFIINRIKSYLAVVKDLQLQYFPVKSMLSMERALQVVGESLQHEPKSESVVSFLLESCISSELLHKFCRMRNDSLSHFRASAVQGRVNVECNNGELLEKILNELNDVDIIFQPVYASQLLRVEEFMTKEAETESQKICSGVPRKMSNHLKHFLFVRRLAFKDQIDNFKHLISNMFCHLYENLEKETFSLSIKGYESLFFLLNFIANLGSRRRRIDFSTLKLSIQELKQTIMEVKDKEITEEIKIDIKECMSSNQEALENIFMNFQTDLPFKFTFPCIISLNDRLKDFDILSIKEKQCIMRKVTEYMIRSADLIRLLKGQLESNTVSEDMKKQLDKMVLSETTRYSLRNLINNINNKKALKLLSKVKEMEDINKLCSLKVPNLFLTQEREEFSNMLLKIKFPKQLKRKIISILNKKLWFLMDRIGKLKSILIFEDENISFLWLSSRWQSNVTVEKHMKLLMVQRFMMEKDLRAALEMLLFDCWNVLEKKEKLENLWMKTNDFFNGANLMDVLGHGNTILQTVGSLLSPEDLPSEFIESVVELMKDADALRALSLFWEKTTLCNEEKFLEALKSEENDDFADLRKKIRICGVRAEEYVKLLPLRK